MNLPAKDSELEINRQLNEDELASMKAGLEVRDLAVVLGHDTKTFVLLDDVKEFYFQSIATHGDDSARWILFRQKPIAAIRDLFKPDVVASEGELLPIGKMIINVLRSKAKIQGQQVIGARLPVNVDGKTVKVKITGF